MSDLITPDNTELNNTAQNNTAIDTIDSSGFSCPQPVIMAKKAMLEKGSGKLKVLGDSNTSRENIIRMAKYMGWAVEVEQLAGEDFILNLNK